MGPSSDGGEPIGDGWSCKVTAAAGSPARAGHTVRRPSARRVVLGQPGTPRRWLQVSGRTDMADRAQKLLSLAPWVVSAGVVTLLAGLAWDAVLHRLDPDLAAREGIFALTNPGHVLFGGGIAIIVAGALLFFAGRALTAPRPLAYALPAV